MFPTGPEAGVIADFVADRGAGQRVVAGPHDLVAGVRVMLARWRALSGRFRSGRKPIGHRRQLALRQDSPEFRQFAGLRNVVEFVAGAFPVKFPVVPALSPQQILSTHHLYWTTAAGLSSCGGAIT